MARKKNSTYPTKECLRCGSDVALIFICRCGEMMQETGLRLEESRLYRMLEPVKGREEEVICGCGKGQWRIAPSDTQDDCCSYCQNMVENDD